jgi:hypothetical protein
MNLSMLPTNCLRTVFRGAGCISWTHVQGSEFFFGDKVREGLTLVGAFPEGTTVTR